ncbi:hypothetical protein KKH15_00735 [Patescibacteria group bacterium]|nr:hypothetical protein [Patescibacteria group bacterium]MBU1755247.1 hypothetical protein [Patescibacteria group bacterium]
MIRLVIWIVVGVLALSFFGVSLKGLIQDPTTQDNFSFLSELVQEGWDHISDWFVDIRDQARDLVKKDN